MGFGFWAMGFESPAFFATCEVPFVLHSCVLSRALLRIRVSDFGFRLTGFGFRVSGFGFRSPGFGFRVVGSGFWVLWDQGFGG